MLNPIVDGRKKLDLLFKKFEEVLQENEVVIGTLMAKQYRADQDLVSVN